MLHPTLNTYPDWIRPDDEPVDETLVGRLLRASRDPVVQAGFLVPLPWWVLAAVWPPLAGLALVVTVAGVWLARRADRSER